MGASYPSNKEVLNLIVPLGDKRKAYLRLLPDLHTSEAWRLDVRLYYQGARAGNTSFTLQGYSQDEAETIARNIRSNSYLMNGIDEFLWSAND